MPHVITQRPDPTGNVYTVAPLGGDGPVKTLQRRDLLDGRSLVSDQLQETPPVQDSCDDEESQSEDDDYDDNVYKVTTLKPQHHTYLPNHEHLTHTPPTVETAGEHDEMLHTVTDEDTRTQHPEDKELWRSQRAGAGCHSNPHHEPRSAVQATQHELQVTQQRVTSEMIAHFCESQLLLANMMTALGTNS